MMVWKRHFLVSMLDFWGVSDTHPTCPTLGKGDKTSSKGDLEGPTSVSGYVGMDIDKIHPPAELPRSHYASVPLPQRFLKVTPPKINEFVP